MGTARLAHWRKTILRQGDGKCEECGAERETLKHVLMECSKWDLQREQMWFDIAKWYEPAQVGECTLAKLLHGDKGKQQLELRVEALRRFLQDTQRIQWVSLAG